MTHHRRPAGRPQKGDAALWQEHGVNGDPMTIPHRPPPRNPIAIDVDGLVDLVAERVIARLGHGAAREYRSSTVLPPGVSRRAFRSVCCSGAIPGARREGRDWVVAVASWHEARSTAPRRRAPVPAESDVALVDELLAGAGLRPSRRAG